ncbi:MAG: threonylcarbamoyl-AMP synthase [Herminiimonas sp.]|nr:threonylcarbamoyl-AMP synthase [Herminiimonas sp.]
MTAAALAGGEQAAIEAAARLLEAGELVAFPTETVYGLGADAQNPQAVRAIYRAKNRPENHPLIVHLAPDADVAYWSNEVNSAAQKLIAAFWPGPLTLILPRADRIPDTVAGGQQSIGLRCPAHPVAQALLQSFQGGFGGIAAPSANRFGHVSPTTAAHVREEFAASPLVRCVLDGGQSAVGIESTILDLTRGVPVLLRPGHVGSIQIAEILGLMPAQPDAAAPRASGTLESHYAPRTPVAIVGHEKMVETLERLRAGGWRLALMHHRPRTRPADASPHAPPDELIATVELQADPVAYGHDLYAALRRLDHAAADLIMVEAPPVSAAWHAVNDRLQRAAHGSAHVVEQLLTTVRG